VNIALHHHCVRRDVELNRRDWRVEILHPVAELSGLLQN